MHFLRPKWFIVLGFFVTTSPAVEVDLVFPRSDASYSPAEWFPFVFAVQNTEKAELLNLQVTCNIRKRNATLKDIDNQLYLNHDFSWTNWSGSADPYLAYNYIHNDFNTSNHWVLLCVLSWQSCDVEALTHGPYANGGVSDHEYRWTMGFHIDNSSLKEVDLVAATANDTCPGSQNAISINVTDRVMNSPRYGNTARRETCVVTTNTTASPTTSTPDPCRVAIDEDTAESMASVQQQRFCYLPVPPDNCPTEENGATPLAVLGHGPTCFTFFRAYAYHHFKTCGIEFNNDLDGVDIDWEYPGAPDLPENDPGTEEDGPNYLAFLVGLKNLLPGKSVSIAAPASYWYLKQFPIKDMAKIVDYIVYMTYDLHGQWDAYNSNSQEGCATGNCLRSQVNLTQTKQSLAMITKSGVPGAKVIVGVTSYGRSFKMADPNCSGTDCLYTCDRLHSDAKKGECTNTAGYLAGAEIDDIMKDSSRVVKSYVDTTSNSDILVFMITMSGAWGLGGTSDWASDLQTYHDVPNPAKSWANFIQLAKAGEDPKTDQTRNGNWTSYNCADDNVANLFDFTPSQRWKNMDTDTAWGDIIRIWNDTDSPRHTTFMESVVSTTHFKGQACDEMESGSCSSIGCEDGANGNHSGPAAFFILYSMAEIHKMYKKYYDGLFMSLSIVGTALDDMENKFAPIPPEEDDTWLNILIDMITLGSLGTAGPLFNTMLKDHDWFAGKTGSALDNAKDTTMTLVGQGTTTAKDLLSPGNEGEWTPEKQDEFSAYMGQVVYGWSNVTSRALFEVSVLIYTQC
ncbi:CAZyme family GH18 [Aspergillus niger]|nr:CAZyme family GH18 [Aspergillus niger]